MKVSELKQIIKEEIVKVLAENESKPTHKSTVDWYYIEDNSDYPGPKKRTVPVAKGFDNPKKYKGTELYVKKEDKGYVKDDKFTVASGEREGNDVEYKAEHFEKISKNSNVLKEDVTLSVDGNSVTISSILVNKLKAAMDVRMRNPEDENAYNEVKNILTQIYRKAGRKNAEELAAGNMEDEVTKTGDLSAVVSLIKDTVAVPYLSSKDKQLIKSFKSWAVDNPTSIDVDTFSRKYNLNPEQQYLLKRVFLSRNKDIKITPTGPLPSDIQPRIGTL